MRKMHGLAEVNTAALTDFVLLSELRSFQRTAEQQGISQPALSRRVQALERAVGASLIDRRSQPIQLSRAGRALLPFVRDSLRRLSEGAEFFIGALSDLADPITFVATHTVATSFFPGWIRSRGLSLRDHQIVMNAFRTERCFDELRAGRADLGLCLVPDGEQEIPGLSLRILDHDELVPVVAPDLQRAAAKRSDSVPLLSYAPGSTMQQAVAKILASESERRTAGSVFESPSSEVLKSMALAGHGVTYLPRMLIRDELKSRKLIELTGRWGSIPLLVYLVRGNTQPNQVIQGIWSADIVSP